MKHTLPRLLPHLTALLVTGLLLQAPLHAQNKPAAKSGTIATVNGVAIPASRSDAFLNDQLAQGQQDSEQLRAAIRNDLINREMLAQAARKKGFDKKPEVQARFEIARQDLLVSAYLQDFVASHPISDEAVKAEYENIIKAMGNKEYKARHILVSTEDEAKNIIAELQKGGKFEELAKQSKDPGSKDRGGELGWNNPAGYVKPFADALVKLEKGKFSATPVKTDYGWHVIQLDDVRDMKHPPFEEVKPQIQQRLQQQAVAKHISELRAQTKIE
ncbi:MAG: peptidylprolyl isomerase [Zoogloeaceae bacterium]|jgi:peptidyl-prolyl cis-trans isomerase C|nr:peptidylprolyl isomerase [Zoogloeaceae bacterium]